MRTPNYKLKGKEEELQRKMVIGASNNQYEKEGQSGDNTNICTESSGEGPIRRKCNECENEIAMNGYAAMGGEMIQKQDGDGEEPFKLTAPSLGGGLSTGFQSNLSFGIPELKIDPKLAFEMEMLRIKMMLSPGHLKRQASKIGSKTLMPPLFPTMPSANNSNQPLTAIPMIPPKTTVAKKPMEVALRAGTRGDLANAILGLPLFKTKLDELKTSAEKFALEKYNGLSTGGKVGLISGAITVAGGTIAGLLAIPKENRLSVLGPISGTKIPIPGTPVSVSYSILDMKKLDLTAPEGSPKVEQVMIHVNIGKLLPKKFGFR